ncbi:probable G-protein coupled receptor Mth-like 12 [Drosophila subpulchrella]|uniref:probable G-protein coupled receptor Mth-like 12 n=1 Tax=Drosophila subpulchrella TaxID=1486046 RepID=UPI0018A15BBD|nr:probable G-protein coupled receptor Mth-like 12 [Drosophila subpulchrella]
MSLYIRFFCSILILTIVKTSLTDIPYCDYFDTVDISGLESVNDTYIYQGLTIPSNLTGEYNYKKLMYGYEQHVEKHLRACACKLWPCVRICCPRKNILANGSCSDGFDEEISMNMVDLTLMESMKRYPSFKDLRMAPKLRFQKLLVLRDEFQASDELVSPKEDEYTILSDGSLIFFNTNELFYKETYCLYPQIPSDFPKSIWIVKHNLMEIWPTGVFETKVVSLIFDILTGLVYLYIKKLRNLLGKCIISCVMCRSMATIFSLLSDNNWLSQFCLLIGYSLKLFNTATLLWTSVISHHLWKLLTSMGREEPRNQFLIYSAFAWGIPAIGTGVIYVINQIWEKDLHKWNMMPLIGYYKCGDGPSDWLSRGLIGICISFNVIMFILTFVHIWKTKSELKKLMRNKEMTITCLSFDTKTYLLFLRLSVIMGAILIMEFVIFFGVFNGRFVLLLYNVFGIIVFIVLILKRSTLILLMER